VTQQQGAAIATTVVAAAATLGVIVRPFDWPEAVWAVAGAVLLVAFRLVAPGEALAGVGKGADVYLFLVGMMLLAETARSEGLFDWLAAVATRHARGSATRLFFLVYAVGTLVTTFLSNDATAVVLTPAVAAAVKTAKAREPLPYLLICAFIANAASFVLPISNPANLVIYGARMPPLLEWVPRFGLASAVSIVATYLVLRFTQRASLAQPVESDVPVPELTSAGIVAACGLGATTVVLLVASAFDVALGLPTAVAGALTTAVVLVRERKSPSLTLRSISWGVFPLVAGLFVLVEGLEKTGLIARLAQTLHEAAGRSSTATAWAAGLTAAVTSNLANNLPVGLIAGSAGQMARVPDPVTSAMLVGVDLGPNLSVTGSLATILWLTVLRREGQSIGAWAFLRLGLLVMPPALVLALAATFLMH
jgi:arsenical pump membrane protein